MTWQFRGHSPVYRQIVRHIRADILNGCYQPDEQIPPVRQLAMEAGVNPNTMQRALVYLEERGLVSAQRNTGRYVTQDAQLISDTRQALAQEELSLFCEKMRLLGFTPEETSQLLKSKGESE